MGRQARRIANSDNSLRRFAIFLLSALTWGDVLGCLRTVVVFAAVLLAPGYCLAWACNLLGFRARATVERLAWAVTLSFAAMTIVAVVVAKVVSLTAVCWLAAICATGCALLLSSGAWPLRHSLASKWRLIGGCIAAAWVLFVIFELVDVGVGSRLYLSVTVFDHALRTAFVDAVMRTGVPPANPLFWPGHAAPMRYYYFWYVLTAVAARMAGATARQAMIASVAWAGIGLAAVLELYCRNFLGSGERQSSGTQHHTASSHPRRFSIALGLLAVTGLDILPVVVKALLHMPADGDMEWWSAAQVSSWLDSLIWVPHHVAGLVCCLLGFLLIWMSKGLGGGQRALCGIMAGLSFASAFGLSTWVAVAFAMVMMAWILWALVWERDSRTRVTVLLLAGLVGVVALLPYLAELRGESSGTASRIATGAASLDGHASMANDGTHLLSFGVRHVIPAESMQGIGWVARLAESHPAPEDAVVGLLLLLPGYFVELGFYGLVLVAALLAMRRCRLDEAARTAVVLAVAGLLVSTFLRSTIVENNDFGMRSILIAQFFLLMLAVVWWEEGLGATHRLLRGAMLTMAWIGLAGTLYQAVLLRVYLPVEEALGRPEVSGLAERAMALRLGFDAMDARIPKDAVVQYNTEQPGEFFYLTEVMQVGRQVASAQAGCGVVFGGDAAACKGVEQGVTRLFELHAVPAEMNLLLSTPVAARSTPSSALSANEARDQCASLGVNYLIATRWDAVWANPPGWVWTLPAVVDTGDVRAVDCAAPRR
jgi:hypothetical protein